MNDMVINTHLHLPLPLPMTILFRCIVRALKDPNTFLFDHLLALKPVRFLEGELIHDVSINMIELVLQYILLVGDFLFISMVSYVYGYFI